MLHGRRGATGCDVTRAKFFAGSLRDGVAGRLDLRLHGLEVEARALLHRRKFDRGLRQLLDLLLDEHEAPELVLEPVEVLLRAFLRAAVGPARALERVEAQVGQEWHIDLGLLAQPAVGLADEAILVVVDAHGAELAFAEVPDLVPLPRSLARDQSGLFPPPAIH